VSSLSAEEQAVVARCIDVFRKLTGAPPKGWLSPVLASSAHTEELLTAAGFLWYGDYNHIDLPFCVERGNGTIVAFPHSDYADHRVLRGNPRDWYDVYKDTFDYLYQNEPTAFLNLTAHCHFGGRPLMAAMVDRILKYFAGFPHVWMVRGKRFSQCRQHRQCRRRVHDGIARADRYVVVANFRLYRPDKVCSREAWSFSDSARENLCQAKLCD